MYVEASKAPIKEQILHDIARTLRWQIVVVPDTDGNAHFCLNCWQRIPDEYCAICATTDYSIPIPTEEQLVPVRWILAHVNLGVHNAVAEDNP